jgi:hypothetical protein
MPKLSSDPPEDCTFRDGEIDGYIADCNADSACWLSGFCEPNIWVNLQPDHQCSRWLCNSVCEEYNFDFCTVRPDPEGPCPEDAKLSDQDVSYLVEICKHDDELSVLVCDDQIKDCKEAWETDSKDVGFDCWRDTCDRICKQNKFSWCPASSGLSTGALVGIIVAAVVVVALVVGGLVYFLVLKKGSDADPPLN